VDEKYFVDTKLAFGLRSAASIFCCLAEALTWICKNIFGIDCLVNYYDDYLIVRSTESDCSRDLQCFLSVCLALNIPIEYRKVEGPGTLMKFLGIELDTINMLARLPPDKLAILLPLIHEWLNKKSCNKVSLQSLVGRLSWCTAIMPSGRIFTRRLIDKIASVKRPFHHIPVNEIGRAHV
jgi:hypothetical protein